MKKQTKVILAILVAASGLLLMLNHLFVKEEKTNTINNTTNSVIKEFIDVSSTTTTKTTKTTKKVVKTTKKTITKKTTIHKETHNGYKLTHYGWDCKGCSGNTAAGYNVKHTIYYNDSSYGKVRIVAMKNIPLYSIIKIKNYKLGGDITAIVLDRGVGSNVIDLLVESEKKSSQLGIQKGVQIEILRKGK